MNKTQERIKSDLKNREDLNYYRTIGMIEEPLIVEALERGGSKREAAKILCISLVTLRTKMNKYGLVYLEKVGRPKTVEEFEAWACGKTLQ